MTKLRAIHFNAQTEAARESIPELLSKPAALGPMLRLPDELRSAEGTGAQLESADRTTSGWTAETAARFYLQTLLESQEAPGMLEATSPERPELVPDMRLEQELDMPLAGTHNVAFIQTHRSIPVFGTRSVVEIDRETRQLVAVDGIVTEVPDISPIPTLGIPEILAKLAEHLNVPAVEPSAPPELCFYPGLNADDVKGPTEAANAESTPWRLAYHVRQVPVKVEDTLREETDFCLGCGVSSPFTDVPHDFLIDANNGEVLLRYPSFATLDMPVICTGVDAEGNSRNFDGILIGPGQFQLTDPIRRMETCDANFADIATSNINASALTHTATSFPSTAAAAVTAHYYASKVCDFFAGVLKRNGIDGKGMKLVSIVNCYNSSRNPDPAPIWRNAMWYNNRMWYGSNADGNGQPITTARFLDVMAHELAHGVTATTSNLIYKNQSGALNESFSDIFGIIIKNWFPSEPNPLSGWSWTLGDNWRGSGSALRSLKDPTLGGAIYPNGPGQPKHMNNFVSTSNDNGGVHINSGIHNHAFYKLATTLEAGTGEPVVPPMELAILYYVTLTRLAPASNFSDCRRTLLNVATTRYIGDSATQTARLKAIRDAYDGVGIV